MSFPYPLVLFDLDGTLFDSAADIAAAVNRTLAELGHPPEEEALIRSWIGDGARVLIERALCHAGSALTVDAVMDGFMRHYGDCLLLHARLYPGVRETLQALQAQGVTLALCTNKPQRFLLPLLEARELDGSFAAMVGGDTLPERKPSALPLLHLCAQFGTAPRDALMVGDSRTDAQAAQAAGVPLVLVSYGYPGEFDVHQAGALAVLDDIRELLTLVPVRGMQGQVQNRDA